ncbi:MAG: universal stress protein [Rhodoferax sp.]|nr:universal stress protein [Rhodoferax sp.]
MFKTILVPVDGSPTALAAARVAADLARVHGSRVVIAFVVDPYPFTGVGTDFAYGQSEYLSAAMAEAQMSVQAAKELFDSAAIPAETSILESHTPWRGVVQAAESQGCDLIVMGSHGRSGLEKWVLGSVTQAVLAHTTRPVLVVRG